MTQFMHTITTEKLVILGVEKPHIFSPHRIKIRLDDQGDGPYLVISGENDEPCTGDGEKGTEFFLCTEGEIDQFAAICKQMLHEAEGDI